MLFNFGACLVILTVTAKSFAQGATSFVLVGDSTTANGYLDPPSAVILANYYLNSRPGQLLTAGVGVMVFAGPH